MIESLALYLAEKLGFELGRDLFIGFLPDSPVNATVIYEYQGQSPLLIQGSGQVAQERLAFQLKFRGEDYQEASSRASLAFRSLCSSECDFEVFPLQSPFSLGWTDKACSFAFNIRIFV